MLTINSDTLKAEVAKHIGDDAVAQGIGDCWAGGKGCFIGCLAHSSDVRVLADKFGLDEGFVRLCDGVFEGVGIEDAKQFFSDFGENVRDGIDTKKIVWTVLRKALQRLPESSRIGTLINLFKRIEAGEGRETLRVYLQDAADYAYAATYAAADSTQSDEAARADYTVAHAVRYAALAALAADDAAYAFYATTYAAGAAAYADDADDADDAEAAERKQQAEDIIRAINSGLPKPYSRADA